MQVPTDAEATELHVRFQRTFIEYGLSVSEAVACADRALRVVMKINDPLNVQGEQDER